MGGGCAISGAGGEPRLVAPAAPLPEMTNEWLASSSYCSMMTFVEDIHLALISPRHNNFTVTVFAKNPAPYDMKCSLFLSFCAFSQRYIVVSQRSPWMLMRHNMTIWLDFQSPEAAGALVVAVPRYD